MVNENEEQAPEQPEAAQAEEAQVEGTPSEDGQTEEPQAESATAAAEESPQVPELTFGGGMTAGDMPEFAPMLRGRVDRFGVAIGTGRRKTSVARVRIRDGNGKFTINGRTIEDYCPLERNRKMIEAPLRATDRLGKVDVWVRVEGGGTTGQAGAILLGIARALEALDHGYHHLLHEHGFLTRDERMVERKKYGKKKARRSFQFSKR